MIRNYTIVLILSGVVCFVNGWVVFPLPNSATSVKTVEPVKPTPVPVQIPLVSTTAAKSSSNVFDIAPSTIKPVSSTRNVFVPSSDLLPPKVKTVEPVKPATVPVQIPLASTTAANSSTNVFDISPSTAKPLLSGTQDVVVPSLDLLPPKLKTVEPVKSTPVPEQNPSFNTTAANSSVELVKPSTVPVQIPLASTTAANSSTSVFDISPSIAKPVLSGTQDVVVPSSDLLLLKVKTVEPVEPTTVPVQIPLAITTAAKFRVEPVKPIPVPVKITLASPTAANTSTNVFDISPSNAKPVLSGTQDVVVPSSDLLPPIKTVEPKEPTIVQVQIPLAITTAANFTVEPVKPTTVPVPIPLASTTAANSSTIVFDIPPSTAKPVLSGTQDVVVPSSDQLPPIKTVEPVEPTIVPVQIPLVITTAANFTVEPVKPTPVPMQIPLYNTTAANSSTNVFDILPSTAKPVLSVTQDVIVPSSDLLLLKVKTVEPVEPTIVPVQIPLAITTAAKFRVEPVKPIPVPVKITLASTTAANTSTNVFNISPSNAKPVLSGTQDVVVPSSNLLPPIKTVEPVEPTIVPVQIPLAITTAANFTVEPVKPTTVPVPIPLASTTAANSSTNVFDIPPSTAKPVLSGPQDVVVPSSDQLSPKVKTVEPVEPTTVPVQIPLAITTGAKFRVEPVKPIPVPVKITLASPTAANSSTNVFDSSPSNAKPVLSGTQHVVVPSSNLLPPIKTVEPVEPTIVPVQIPLAITTAANFTVEPVKPTTVPVPIPLASTTAANSSTIVFDIPPSTAKPVLSGTQDVVVPSPDQLPPKVKTVEPVKSTPVPDQNPSFNTTAANSTVEPVKPIPVPVKITLASTTAANSSTNVFDISPSTAKPVLSGTQDVVVPSSDLLPPKIKTVEPVKPTPAPMQNPLASTTAANSSTNVFDILPSTAKPVLSVTQDVIVPSSDLLPPKTEYVEYEP